jgi:hypothetical protein
MPSDGGAFEPCSSVNTALGVIEVLAKSPRYLRRSIKINQTLGIDVFIVLPEWNDEWEFRSRFCIREI